MRDCRKCFSVKTATVTQPSNLGYQVWAVPIYLSLTSLKSVSSMNLNRYAQKFAGKHNVRVHDTLEQMGGAVIGMVGKRLRYTDLIADNGFDSMAR